MKTLSKNIFSLLLVGLMIFSMTVIPAGATVDGDSNIPDGMTGTVVFSENFEDYSTDLTARDITTKFTNDNNVPMVFRAEYTANATTDGTADLSGMSSANANLSVTSGVISNGSKALKIYKKYGAYAKNLGLSIGLVPGEATVDAIGMSNPTKKISSGLYKATFNLQFEATGGYYAPGINGGADMAQPIVAFAHGAGPNFLAGLGVETATNRYAKVRVGSESVRFANDFKWAGSNTVTMYIDYTVETPVAWFVLSNSNGTSTTSKYPIAVPDAPLAGDAEWNEAVAYKLLASINFSYSPYDYTNGTLIDNITVTRYDYPASEEEAEIEVGTPAVTGDLTQGNAVAVTSKFVNNTQAQIEDAVLVAAACDGTGAIKGIVYGTNDIPVGAEGADVTANFASFPAGATQLKIFALKSFASLKALGEVMLYPSAQ